MLRRWMSWWSTDRSLSLLLLFLCGVIFLVIPLRELGVVGGNTVSVFFSLILVSGVMAVSRGLLAPVIVGALVVASVAVRWTNTVLDIPSLEVWDVLLSLVACAALAVVVTAQVFRAGRITSGRIQGAVAVYLVIGLMWSFAYRLVALLRPDSFSFPAAEHADMASRFVYFSFVVLTTVGFGDITPADSVSRTLATLEALVGQLFPAILLARLVSMEILHTHAGTAPDAAGAPVPPDQAREPHADRPGDESRARKE